jgi:hypothetical protein
MADISTAVDISTTESAMENIVQRALNVVKSNPEWITYIKTFNNPRGFVFCDDKILDEITSAVDDENPIHSGASLALCLQKCRIILNNT